MKKSTWSVRRLVDESFVPSAQRTSVLYCRLSDLFTQGICSQGSFNKIMIFSSKNHLKVWLIKLLCLLLCYTLLSHWNLFYTRLLSQRISYFHHIWRIFHYNDNKWDPMINRWSEFVLTSLKVTLEQDNIKKDIFFGQFQVFLSIFGRCGAIFGGPKLYLPYYKS